MQGKRLERVGHLMQMELAELILKRVKDPRLGSFVTITHVSPANDLKSAMVFYSVFGDEKKKKDVQRALENAAGFFQKEIAEAIEMRYTPKLKFSLDDSIERGLEIDRLIHNLEKEKKES